MGSENCNYDASRSLDTVEENRFKQCGIVIEQQEYGSMQHQEEFRAGVTVTEKEKLQLRALLGALQWQVTQTCLYAMVDVNLFAKLGNGCNS